jgi:glycosyltransferase involved in cell wall biosynthesis
MKIAILVRILWSAGTQKFAIEQARALANYGCDVEIIFLRRAKNGDVYDDLLNGVNYRVLTDKNNSSLASLYDYITGIFMETRKGEGRVDYNLLRRFPNYAKNKYDLIICQDQWAGLSGYYTWKRFRIPYIVILHERVNNFPWIRGFKRILVRVALYYQRKILQNAKGVFSLTKKVADNAISFYSRDDLHVIDNFPGLELRNFVDYYEKSNTIVLLSYWNEVKVPEMYFDLFKTLENYKFLMLGNWISESYRDQYVSKIRKMGISDRVILKSGLSEDEKNELISRSKFCVRFGMGEYGPGIGSIEALALGVPLIINRELGIADQIEGYQLGLIVNDVCDVGSVVRFVEEHDNVESYRDSQNEIRRFVEDHSWNKHCERLLKYVEND